MKIKILYFAYFKDTMGRTEETLEIPEEISSFGALTCYLIEKGEPWKTTFSNLKRLKGAVNHELAQDDTPISEGDEVAYFPPVTGG